MVCHYSFVLYMYAVIHGKGGAMNTKILEGIGWFFFGSFLVTLFQGVTIAGGLIAIASAVCLCAASMKKNQK